MSDNFVVLIPGPSLGDHLYAAGVPELMFKRHRRYSVLSSKNKFYDPLHKKLLYDINPYVIGVTDEAPMFTLPDRDKPTPPRWMPDLINQQLGFNEPEGFIPPLYYVPKPSVVKPDSILIDVASRSYSSRRCIGDKKVDEIVRASGKPVYALTWENPDCTISRYVPEYATKIKVRDLFEYCDTVAGFGEVICFNSGGALLTASIKAKVSPDMILTILNLPYPADNQNSNPPNSKIIIV